MTRRIPPIVSLLLAVVLPAAGAQPFAEHRTFDGRGNNREHPEWGSAGVPLLRVVAPAYADGVGEPSGAERPNVREISNLVVASPPGEPPKVGAATALVWVWGQFVDHDIGLTGTQDEAGFCAEPFDVEVPAGDPHFDPLGTGGATIELCRSRYQPAATGTGAGNPRQQLNEISALIDASNVYGSDPERALALRRLDGSGRLAVTPGIQPGPRFAALEPRRSAQCRAAGAGAGGAVPRRRPPRQREAGAAGDAHAVGARAQLLGAGDRRGVR